MVDDQANENDSREMMDRLNEQNRILLEARMLPRGKTLSQEHVDGVRDAFKDYIDRRGVKPSQVAREVDYVPGVLSNWMAGKYKGDVDKVTHAINDWMERDRRRHDAARPSDYVKTWVAETMRSIAYQADQTGLMAAIVAPAGCGKSKVMKALTEEMRGIYVYCDPDITERELLFKIARAVGWEKKIASKATLRQFIVDELQDTKRIIFLDEAQQMRKAIRVVRSIFDQANAPIVMAGTAEILAYVDDRADGRGQFASRCIRYSVLESVRDAERPDGGGSSAGRDLFTIEEIQSFFASRKIRLAVDALRLMWLLACQMNHGTLRLIENLATIASIANPSAHVLQREHILEALEMFRGPKGATYLEQLTVKHSQLAKVG